MKILTELKLKSVVGEGGGVGEGPKDPKDKVAPTSLSPEAASSRRNTLEPDLIPSDDEDLQAEKDKLKKYLEESKQKNDQANQHHQQVLQLLEKEGGWAAMLAGIVELGKKIQDTDFKAVLTNFATAVHNIKCKPGEELEFQGIDKWQNNAAAAQQRLDEIEKELKKEKPSPDSKQIGAGKDKPVAKEEAASTDITPPVPPQSLNGLSGPGGSALAAGGKPKQTPSQGADPSSKASPPKAG